MILLKIAKLIWKKYWRQLGLVVEYTRRLRKENAAMMTARFVFAGYGYFYFYANKVEVLCAARK